MDCVSNRHVAHLKPTQCHMSIISSQSWGEEPCREVCPLHSLCSAQKLCQYLQALRCPGVSGTRQSSVLTEASCPLNSDSLPRPIDDSAFSASASLFRDLIYVELGGICPSVTLCPPGSSILSKWQSLLFLKAEYCFPVRAHHDAFTRGHLGRTTSGLLGMMLFQVRWNPVFHEAQKHVGSSLFMGAQCCRCLGSSSS